MLFYMCFYIFRKLFTLESFNALRFTKLGTQKLSATNARIWLAKHLLETSHTHLLDLELRVAMTCQPSPKDRTDLVEIEQLFQRLDEASEAHAKGLENRVVTLRRFCWIFKLRFSQETFHAQRWWWVRLLLTIIRRQRPWMSELLIRPCK